MNTLKDMIIVAKATSDNNLLYNMFLRKGYLLHLAKSTSFLDSLYKKVYFKQRIWHILNVLSPKLCPVCKVGVSRYHKCWGYICCSKECSKVARVESMGKTVRDRYNVKNVMELESTKAAIKRTMFKNYGSHYSKTEEFRDLMSANNPMDDINVRIKGKNTCIERYGVDNPMKSSLIIRKHRENFIRKHGVDNSMKLDSSIEKYKNNMMSLYGVDNPMKLASQKEISTNRDFNNFSYLYEENGYELIKYDSGITTILHKKCGKISTGKNLIFNLRRNTYKVEMCTHCNPLFKGISGCERKLYDFIKSIYHNEIICNSKKLTYPFELDIYLPDLNLAFEFNGTYHHADPRFYEPNDMVYHKTAKDIWNKDERKFIRCMSKGINVVTIWEYDWYKNNEHIKNLILKWVS